MIQWSIACLYICCGRSKSMYKKQPFTGDKTFRDWLNGKSFDEQLDYGIKIWTTEMKNAGYTV